MHTINHTSPVINCRNIESEGMRVDSFKHTGVQYLFLIYLYAYHQTDEFHNTTRHMPKPIKVVG